MNLDKNDIITFTLIGILIVYVFVLAQYIPNQQELKKKWDFANYQLAACDTSFICKNACPSGIKVNPNSLVLPEGWDK